MLVSCFRWAAQAKLIEDAEQWFEFISIRNLCSHTYEQDMADRVEVHFEDFSLALNHLIINLKALQ